jgi:hypothetical protein
MSEDRIQGRWCARGRQRAKALNGPAQVCTVVKYT